ncbi:hypothetical protein E2562_008900 [Oryza meyeriana var. granulata]|uniref:Uncharacterized protein n=1 Tax=Oryza meyeriana var. granulata TaxID=110450 RepID=A0A6G1D0A9_9ORYZ|nr:hypothetical protein E2562_008900 [Oryza meyeriana var. granulata]KAF0905866.1 hypothetical protein E2562_008900 [Oryza meyeriana var. granulata]KAF0905867.1 hypothetical protein E2562_008900 [Oryza meyeriana var. granulata]KAF0905868.1 hypothetical protein E2562_008900 [Oryza meyeriana var. granulata]
MSHALYFVDNGGEVMLVHRLLRMHRGTDGVVGDLKRIYDVHRGDFRLFLACRAEEVRCDGLLLLTFVAGREAVPLAHDCHLWDLLAAAVEGMAAEGLVDACRLDSFELPYYGPCPDELTEAIREEVSFEVRSMELFEVSRRHQLMASTIRAVVEPMLGAHFGWDAMDDLFRSLGSKSGLRTMVSIKNINKSHVAFKVTNTILL